MSAGPTPVGVVQQASAASSRPRPAAAAAPDSGATGRRNPLGMRRPVRLRGATLPPRSLGQRVHDACASAAPLSAHACTAIASANAAFSSAGRCAGWPEWRQPGCPIAARAVAGRREFPAFSATSSMLTASTVGSPNSSTWLTRYRLRSRLPASTMQTTASTAARPSAGPTTDRPRPFRRATGGPDCKGPAGRSTRTGGRPSSIWPVFFSTVTPG